ncbi:MAG: sulfatase [Planctomycetota bacterium]|nr:sulfatase [Planctomycetota bacterium]
MNTRITVALFIGLLPLVGSAESPQVAKPNILFCIADDWGCPHAGAYGDPVVKTPAFDRIAREGVVFDHAYVSSPSCTPCRNSILTGQFHWRLGPGANLHSKISAKHPFYPLLLEKAGYHIGRWRKSYGPGPLPDGPHPVGKNYSKGFAEFIKLRPKGVPFCFWLGSSDPHRAYKLGSGKASGMDLSKIPVPKFWPDHETVRSDIADYYFEVQRFDNDVANAISLLEESGELENTIVVMTGDHGMPFPRCKSNLYDMGVRVPLAIRWGKNVGIGQEIPGNSGHRVGEFVSLTDLAPTFLQAAGLEVPKQMTGRSLIPLVVKKVPQPAVQDRSHVIFGMERHTPAQTSPSIAGYPCRGLRTAGWIYIRNFEPNRWPAGVPSGSTRGRSYSDCDDGPTKTYILKNRDAADFKIYYDLCFARRPAEELYDLSVDPDQLHNLASDSVYAEKKAELADKLIAELRATGDPRIIGKGEVFDGYPYYGKKTSKK